MNILPSSGSSHNDRICECIFCDIPLTKRVLQNIHRVMNHDYKIQGTLLNNYDPELSNLYATMVWCVPQYSRVRRGRIW